MKKSNPHSIEQTKAFIEYFKHLATLSTGSIVLIAAFLEKLFAQPLWKGVIVLSLIGFIVSILSTIIAYTVFVQYGFEEEEPNLPGWAAFIGLIGILLTWMGFLTGIVSLAIFALKNLLK